MIYRLHVPGGIPYNPEEHDQTQLAYIVYGAIRARRPIMLAPRTEPYPVTPELSDESIALHFVIPLMDGRGIFEIVKMPAQTQTQEKSRRILYVPGAVQEKEQVILPDDRPGMIIAARVGNTTVFRIVDIIFYYPEVPLVDPLVPFSIN